MTIIASKGHNWEEIKAKAKMDIDRKAELSRRLLLTPIKGQEYVYQEKFREAEAYWANPEQEAGLFPFLHAEATATSSTLAQAANAIISARQAMNVKLAWIEMARRTAKLEIDGCENRLSIITSIVQNATFNFPQG